MISVVNFHWQNRYTRIIGDGQMDQEAQTLFALIDAAYAEDLNEQFANYQRLLLKRAGELVNGTPAHTVQMELYQDYHDNYIVGLALPPKNRALYGYIKLQLAKLSQKELRDLNIGYGLVATHFMYGPLN